MLNIDFLPDRIRVQRARRRRLIRQGYLLAVCVGALAFLAYVRQGRLASAKAELDLLSERAQNARRQLRIRDDLEREEAKLALKKRIDDQLGSRVSVRDIVAEISRLLPRSTSLTRLDVEAMEVPVDVESARRAGRSGRARSAGRPRGGDSRYRMVKRVRLSITGLAPNDVDVANFIGQLAACPLFEEVHMGYAKTVEFRGREAREFQTKCYVVR
jgi:Tfp pilus assembly protein PilN